MIIISRQIKKIWKQTLYSQWGLSAQNTMATASTAAGIVDTQKQIRHLSIK